MKRNEMKPVFQTSKFAALFSMLLTLCCLTVNNAWSALTIEIIGGAAMQIPVAIAPFAQEGALQQSITSIVSADLQRSGQFKLVDPAGISPLPFEPAQVRYPEWRGRGADALVIGSVVPAASGNYEIRFRLLDVLKQTQLAGFSYTVSASQFRVTAHKIADIIYEKLTGDVGIFNTKIAYIVKQGKKYELQVSDADGYAAQTVVTSYEPLLSPRWSADGNQLAYVSFERKKPVVFVQSLATGARHVLANFKGSNSSPAWMPDGRRLAVTLTKDGSSQIYLINPDGSGVARWTFSSAIDTEANFSPDGKWMLFTSDRGGGPQIYRMSSAGGDAQRVTFDGSYNVSPRFSPDGKSFVFIQRSGSQFHVAVQDLENGQVQVLTDTHQDESPSFAPNGKMVLYATEVNGRGILAAVSSDGRTKQRLSVQAGDVREPAWGPLLHN